MKITTNAIIFSHGVFCVLGAYVRPDFLAPASRAEQNPTLFPVNENGFFAKSDDSPTGFRSAFQPSTMPSLMTVNQTLKNTSTANLVQKVLSTLRRRPIPATVGPNKQLFGGKLPGFIERVIQRIQNYFSVYNPPEYFESNQPATAYNDSIAVICSNNVQNDSLSCNPIAESEYMEECDVSENSVSQTSTDDGYNIVVTHTVVHDNLINVYSPADTSGSQVVSNVVVILEPSAAEYSPPSPPPLEPPRNKDKFYVYVNPTAANKKKDQYGTKQGENESEERPEVFQPYVNATYTVIIKGDKLQEFSNNLENADNNSLNPDISIYSESSMSVGKPMDGRCKYGAAPECKQKSLTPPRPPEGESVLASRSVDQAKETDVPNINVVLVPPLDQGNRSCMKNKFDNANIEYYILKPDNGSVITRPKDIAKMAMYYLQKTRLDATSATYLPPQETQNTTDDSQPEISTQAAATTEKTNKLPLLLNLFKGKPEEPRES